MAVITISLKEYGPWFISGIPRQIEFSTNIPSIIYYTLDSSEPTDSSSVYYEPITLPTISGTVRVCALAISGNDSGTLDVTFSTDNSHLFFPRRSDYLGGQGIVVDAYNVDPVLIDGYGADANNYIIEPVRQSDYPLDELDIKYSRTGSDGYGPGTLIRMGIPPESYWSNDTNDHEASSPNDNNVFFNPRSLYITIDGRDGYDDEIVYPINRPLNSPMNPVKYLQGKSFYLPNPTISGGFVRYFINADTNSIVSYYYDNVDSRWIKSIQTFNSENYPKKLGNRNLKGGPIVFKWIYNKRSMI